MSEEKKSLVESINDDIDGIKKKLDDLKGVAKEYISTTSRAQDALRAGFQTTCEAGIAKLFGLDDLTVEACNEFIPRHNQKVNEWLEKQKEDLNKYFDSYAKKMRNIEVRNLYVNFGKWYKKPWEWLYNLINIPGKKEEIKSKTFPTPRILDIRISKPDFDTLNGQINCEVEIICTPHLSIKHVKQNGMDYYYLSNDKKWPMFKHTTYTQTLNSTAKRGKVAYESFDTYSKKYIPEEVIDLVKEAKAIGMENIQVAFPALESGNRENNPDITPAKKDPIVIGYISRGKDLRPEMWIIAWFGYQKDDYSKDQPVACMY